MIWVALCAGAGIGSAWAQPAPEAAQSATEIQRRQEQEIDAQRARAAERPDVLSAPSAAQPGGLTLPPENPCFVLREVIWEGDEPPDLLARATAIVLGECVGGRGLRALQEHLIGLLIDDGLVTARVVVPEQSLAEGSLTLRYLPGRISAVQSQDGIGWWRTALPTGPGGELNQRDLDQALENIRRLGSQADAAIDIAPGPELGDSDILIKPGTGKRWHGYLGGDNGGMDTVGKYQLNAGLTLAQVFTHDVDLLAALRLANGVSNGVVFVLAPALVLEWLALRQATALSGLVYLGLGGGMAAQVERQAHASQRGDALGAGQVELLVAAPAVNEQHARHLVFGRQKRAGQLLVRHIDFDWVAKGGHRRPPECPRI